MRDIAAKTDNVGDVLAAAAFNANLRSELQNIAVSGGFTLDPEAGPDTDLNMLGKTLTLYSAGAQFYPDSGAANAYVLTRSGNLKPVTSYINGLVVCFLVGNSNTGASTINIDSVGSKSVVHADGSALTGGELTANTIQAVRYNSSNDNFEIVGNVLGLNTVTLVTASGTYTPPSGVKMLDVIAIGAGGGAGGVDGQGSGTGVSGVPGSGGGYARKLISVIESSYTVTIGAGGSGGAAGANDGSDGGDTTFVGSSTSLTGGGGVGGLGRTGTSSNLTAVGVAGGVGSGGDINGNGTASVGGGALSGSATIAGSSGCSAILGGGKVNAFAATGTDGTIYGEGGSSAYHNNSSSDWAGGDGMDGVVIVIEHY